MESKARFKTERVADLAHGLDSRSGLFGAPGGCSSLVNMTFVEKGALAKRKGGQQLQKFIVQSSDPASLPPGPRLVQTAGGSLADGTYEVAYGIACDGGTLQLTSPTTTIVVAGGGGTAGIKIEIRSVNVGEGAQEWLSVGTYPFFIDDPFNGGYGLIPGGFYIWAKKGADALTFQAAVGAPTWGLDTLSSYSYKVTMLTYTTNGTGALTTSGSVPSRGLFWHSGLDALIGFNGSTAWYSRGAFTDNLTLAQGVDKAGNAYQFSRLPMRIKAAWMNGVMVVTDGVSKPKKLDCAVNATTGVITPSRFLLVGANPPTVAATAAQSGAAGVGNGSYLWCYTYVFRTFKDDGSSYDVESNGGPNVSFTVTGGPRNVTITMTASLESNIIAYNVYRTPAGGGPLLYVGQSATNVYVDTTPDATLALTTTQPPGIYAGIPGNDTPPAQLYHICEFSNSLFAVVMKPVIPSFSLTDFNGKLRLMRGTNKVLWTLTGTIDVWPRSTAFNYSTACGSSAAITGLISFKGSLWVFKDTEIGVIEGTASNNFSYRTIWTGRGALSHSMVVAGDKLYFWDQAKGPMVSSGSDIAEIGTDEIQEAWLAARSTIRCVGVVEDLDQNLLRWSFTDMDTAPPTTTPTTWFEYVAKQNSDGTLSWAKWVGTTSGSTTDRRIGAACVAPIGTGPTNGDFRTRFRNYSTITCDYHGRVCKDNVYEFDLDAGAASGTAIAFSGTLANFFFGDNPEAVKLYRHMYACFRMGATGADALTFQAVSLSRQATPVTVKAFAGGAGVSGIDQMQRMDVKAAWDGLNTEERGFKLNFTGSAISGPLRIWMLSMKFKDISETRNAP